MLGVLGVEHSADPERKVRIAEVEIQMLSAAAEVAAVGFGLGFYRFVCLEAFFARERESFPVAAGMELGC